MKSKLIYLALATMLAASPFAIAGEPEKAPGKDSTSTTVPQPPTPPATDPANSKGAAGTGAGKEQGKDSTSTDVPVPPKANGDKAEAK